MKRKLSIGNNWPLTTKITIAFLLAALIPSLGVSLYQLNIGSSLLQYMAEGELNLLASGVAGRLDQLFEDTKVAVEQVSTDPAVSRILMEPVSEEAQTAVESRFWDILRSNPDYEYVYLLAEDGVAIVSIQQPGLPSIQGSKFDNRQYFQEAIAGYSYIDALVGRSSKKLGFYFSAPVMDANEGILGVAIIKLKGSAITNITNNFDDESGVISVFLVDGDGIVVSAPSYAPDWRLKGIIDLPSETIKVVEDRFVMETPLEFLNIPELGDLMNTEDNLTEYYDESMNSDYIIGYQATENLAWIVGVSMSDVYFREPIVNLAWQTGIAILALIAIIVFLAFSLGRGIARPVAKLADVAQDVEDDKPFSPNDIADVMALGDEVGHLARVFSAMVLALRARMAELETIYEIGNKISSSVDLTDTLSDVIDSLGNVIDFEAAEICLYDERDKQLLLYVTRDDVFSDDDTVEKIVYSPKNDYFPRLFTDRHGLLVPDMDAYDKYQMSTPRSWDAYKPKSYLGVPLRNRQRVVGTIELISSVVNAFSDDNCRILESISIQAAVALSNAQEVRERERRLVNMEISVDEGRVEQELDSITNRPFFKELIKKVGKKRSS